MSENPIDRTHPALQPAGVDQIQIWLRIKTDEVEVPAPGAPTVLDDWLIAPVWLERGYRLACEPVIGSDAEYWLLLEKPWNTLDELAEELSFLDGQTTYDAFDAPGLTVEDANDD
jgi:hypothetical protein